MLTIATPPSLDIFCLVRFNDALACNTTSSTKQTIVTASNRRGADSYSGRPQRSVWKPVKTHPGPPPCVGAPHPRARTYSGSSAFPRERDNGLLVDVRRAFRSVPLMTSWDPIHPGLMVLRNLIVAPITEEIVFRGCMVPLLLPHFGCVACGTERHCARFACLCTNIYYFSVWC